MWGYDCRSVMWRSKWCKKGELEEYTEVLVQAPTEKKLRKQHATVKLQVQWQ